MRAINADLLGLTDMEIIMCDGDYKEALKMLIDKIEHAPTIEPERKKGKWIPVCGNKQCNCSVCNEGYDHTFEFIEKWNFCPNCGADMREDQHDQSK